MRMLGRAATETGYPATHTGSNKDAPSATKKAGAALSHGTRTWKLELLSEGAEQLAECALDLDRDQTAECVQSLAARVAETKTLLRPPAAARMATRMRQALTSNRRGDLTSVSLAAMELYRLAVREISLDARRTPIHINLLTYVALKLTALSRQEATKWPVVESAVGEAVMHAYHLGDDLDALGIDRALLRTLAAFSRALRTKEPSEIEHTARRLHIELWPKVGDGMNW